MAITLSRVGSIVPGVHRTNTYDITFDGAYPAGGYTITAAQLGGRKGSRILHAYDGFTDNGFACHWIPGSSAIQGKLKVFKVGAAGAMTEAAAGDLSTAVKFRLRAEIKN